jgi:HlyD family secretion protein
VKLQRKTLIALGIAATLIGGAVSLGASAGDDAEVALSQKPALTISTDVPMPMNLPIKLAANGSVLAWQEASIGAESNGLRLSEVRVNVGDTVRKGDVLARFAPETVSAELQQLIAIVAEAEAAAGEASANAERARGLQKTGALSEQQINQYITAEQTALARVNAQRAAAEAQRLRLTKTVVLAPDDGVISARSATVGAVVPAGTELFRMIRQGRLEWRAEVTSAELAQLTPGANATLIAPSGAKVTGTVRMVAPSVDPQTRLGIVYVDLPRGSALKAGMFARGEFDLGASMALTVPQQAVVVRDGFSYVFQLTADNRVELTKVKTGRRSAERVEVLDLTNDTTLVASGAGFLQDGDLVRVAEARKRTPGHEMAGTVTTKERQKNKPAA